MDTSWQLILAMVGGFALAQVPRALETMGLAVKYRQRRLDDDYVRMRASLVSLHYWLTEQSSRQDNVSPRQFVVWRDYVSAVLAGPAKPFADPAEQRPKPEVAKGAGA
jgi:hypothetical protein